MVVRKIEIKYTEDNRNKIKNENKSVEKKWDENTPQNKKIEKITHNILDSPINNTIFFSILIFSRLTVAVSLF